MSFIYSQALAEASLPASYLDTEQSAQSSGSPTPKPCLWHDKTMGHSRLSRFGMTCRPLTESHGAELLTSWRAGFHAKTSALPETAQELTESAAGCGRTWPGSLAKYDPDTSSWKTAQHSLLKGLDEFSETWPRWGLMRVGECWELPISERPIKESASGLWPTPVASDTSSRTKPYAQGGTPLSLAVKTWPTPQASDNRNRGTRSTPAIARRIEAGKQVMLSMCMDGPLNPAWVEWLMGWPIGHTDLKPLETDRCQSVRPWHGHFLEALRSFINE